MKATKTLTGLSSRQKYVKKSKRVIANTPKHRQSEGFIYNYEQNQELEPVFVADFEKMCPFTGVPATSCAELHYRVWLALGREGRCTPSPLNYHLPS